MLIYDHLLIALLISFGHMLVTQGRLKENGIGKVGFYVGSKEGVRMPTA